MLPKIILFLIAVTITLSRTFCASQFLNSILSQQEIQSPQQQQQQLSQNPISTPSSNSNTQTSGGNNNNNNISSNSNSNSNTNTLDENAAR